MSPREVERKAREAWRVVSRVRRFLSGLGVPFLGRIAEPVGYAEGRQATFNWEEVRKDVVMEMDGWELIEFLHEMRDDVVSVYYGSEQVGRRYRLWFFIVTKDRKTYAASVDV